MSSLNKVILIGNVGKDPESRTFQSGDELVSFSLATTESYKNKNTGDWVNNTEWHYIKVYNQNLINLIKNYVKKGSKLYVEGQLKTESFKNNKGEETKLTHILLSKFKGDIKILDKREANEDGDSRKELTQNSYQDHGDEIPF